MLVVDDEETFQAISKQFKIDGVRAKGRVLLGSVLNDYNNIHAVSVFLVILNQAESVPYLKVTCKNGKRLLYRSPNAETTNQLFKLLRILDVAFEYCFFSPMRQVATKAWDKFSVEDFYTAEVCSFYNHAHSLIGKSLNTYLKQTPTYNILLISVGCGNGKDLTNISRGLIGKNIAIAGFDINPQNIQVAEKSHIRGCFISGDIKDIDKNIAEIEKWHSSIHKENETYLRAFVFSGILQPPIIDGTMRTTRYLQCACRNAQLVFVTNITTTLMNKSIAKSVGFNVSTQQLNLTNSGKNNESRVLYILEKQNPEERLRYIINKSDKRSRVGARTNIDLSLSATPLADLKLIFENQRERFTDTIQIDLSWSYIAEHELEIITRFMIDNSPVLTRLIIANVEPWAEPLLKMHLPVKICQRKDNVNEREVPEFSVSSGRFFRLYDSLSVEILQDYISNKSQPSI